MEVFPKKGNFSPKYITPRGNKVNQELQIPPFKKLGSNRKSSRRGEWKEEGPISSKKWVFLKNKKCRKKGLRKKLLVSQEMGNPRIPTPE